MENVAKKLKLFKRERGTFIIATSSIYCNCHYKLRNNWKPVISFAVIFGLLDFCSWYLSWLDLVSRDPKLRTSRIIVHARFLRLTSSYHFIFNMFKNRCFFLLFNSPANSIWTGHPHQTTLKIIFIGLLNLSAGSFRHNGNDKALGLDWALLSSVLGPWSGPLATPLYTPLQTTVFQCLSKHLFDGKPLLLTCD